MPAGPMHLADWTSRAWRRVSGGERRDEAEPPISKQTRDKGRNKRQVRAGWFHRRVGWHARLDDRDPLVRFGRNLRRARQIAGISQQRLADLSGVSQSVISRLERAKAPMVGLERLLMLERVLGSAWPLGECPHDHSCIW